MVIQKSSLVLFIFTVAVFSGCRSVDEGPTNASIPTGPTGPTQTPAERREIAAQQEREMNAIQMSETYPEREVFSSTRYTVRPEERVVPSGNTVQLGVGEIRPVLHTTMNEGLALYLPYEARSVSQIVLEKDGFDRTYFLKGLAPGETVGGVVQRDWLDFDGYEAKDSAMMGRIQQAINAQPVFIQVVNR